MEKEIWTNLIAVGTTSLYGIHSQYNGIPHFKTLGESSGKISIKPDDEFYDPWHQWLKENRRDWYKKHITEEEEEMVRVWVMKETDLLVVSNKRF